MSTSPKIPLNIVFSLNLESTYSFLLSRIEDLNKDLYRKQIETQDKYNDIVSASDEEKRKDYDADFTVLENYINKINEKIKTINEFEENFISALNTQREQLYELNDMSLDLKDHLRDVQIGTLEEKMKDMLKNLPKEELDKLPETVKAILKKTYGGNKYKYTRKIKNKLQKRKTKNINRKNTK